MKAAVERFSEAEVTDRAAALAYYGFLSLFPALIVAVAVLALVGSYPETYDAIFDTLHDAAPGNRRRPDRQRPAGRAAGARTGRRPARDRPGAGAVSGSGGTGGRDPRAGGDRGPAGGLGYSPGDGSPGSG